MKWKLVGGLSLFGLGMGLGTVFGIPAAVEPLFWAAIIGACGLMIPRCTPVRRFQHGFFVGLAIGVWVTAAHLLWFREYLPYHPAEAGLLASGPLSPRAMMLTTGVVGGLAAGCLVGAWAALAGRVVKAVRPHLEASGA